MSEAVSIDWSASHDGFRRSAQPILRTCGASLPSSECRFLSRQLLPNLPDGQIAKSVSSPFAKNISVHFRGKSPVYLSSSRPTGGAARDRHGRGTGCSGRDVSKDEWHCLRTAKPCGPDAPTLASSSREASFSRAMVANKPGHQGEREVSRKPLRGESRSDSG